MKAAVAGDSVINRPPFLQHLRFHKGKLLMALCPIRNAETTVLQDPWTEKVVVKAWTASTAYVVGNIVRSTTLTNAPGTGNYYQCTVAGTSGASAPTWTTTGTTVSDNGITWQDIGAGYAGDLVQRPNGLVAFLTGLQSLPNQNIASFSYLGAQSVAKASGTTAADGEAIYFDASAQLFVTSAPSYGFYAGTARGAWVNGSTTGVLVVNTPLTMSAFAGAALTLSGALVTQSTLAVTGTSTLSGAVSCASTLAVAGTLAVTGGTTLSASLKIAVNNTPVTATVGIAAIGAQDVVRVTGITGQPAYGVKLLTGVPGQVITIIETGGFACTVQAASGGTISGLGANAPVTIAPYHIIRLYCLAADTWQAEDCGARLAV
jgi:hypothetical protein